MRRISLEPEDSAYPPLRTVLRVGDRLLIGRSSCADLRLTPMVISSRHASLWLSPGGGDLLVTDLSRNGIRIQARSQQEESVKGCTHASGADNTRVVPDGARLVFVACKDLSPPTITYTVRVERVDSAESHAPRQSQPAPSPLPPALPPPPPPPPQQQQQVGKRKLSASHPPAEEGGEGVKRRALRPPAESPAQVFPAQLRVAPAESPAQAPNAQWRVASPVAPLRQSELVFIMDRSVHADFEIGAYVQVRASV